MKNFEMPVFCTNNEMVKKHIDVFKIQGIMSVTVVPMFQGRRGGFDRHRLQILEVTITAREGSGSAICFSVAHESGCSIPFVVESYLYEFGLLPTWLWTSHANGTYSGQFGRQGSGKEVSDSGALRFAEVI